LPEEAGLRRNHRKITTPGPTHGTGSFLLSILAERARLSYQAPDHMKPATKRVVIKGTVLTLALHAFVVYSQYHEHGFISSAVWSKLALSLSISLLLIFGLGFLLGLVMKDSEEREPAKKKKSR
jgi:hypothetical protein